jgi:hypothetical protein
VLVAARYLIRWRAARTSWEGRWCIGWLERLRARGLVDIAGRRSEVVLRTRGNGMRARLRCFGASVGGV